MEIPDAIRSNSVTVTARVDVHTGRKNRFVFVFSTVVEHHSLLSNRWSQVQFLLFEEHGSQLLRLDRILFAFECDESKASADTLIVFDDFAFLDFSILGEEFFDLVFFRIKCNSTNEHTVRDLDSVFDNVRHYETQRLVRWCMVVWRFVSILRTCSATCRLRVRRPNMVLRGIDIFFFRDSLF